MQKSLQAIGYDFASKAISLGTEVAAASTHSFSYLID